MPVVFRERGLSFHIYTDDHPPPHVHVRGDGEVKIDIGASRASVVWNKGLSVRYIKIALGVVNRERATLLDAWARYMADFDEREFEAATERGREHFVEHSHARSARYDASTGMVVLDLYNGCTFAVPTRQLQGLENATDEQLAEIELSGWGFGLHWEELDADFTVPGLLAGIFGTKRYMESHRERLRAILQEIEQSDLRPAAE